VRFYFIILLLFSFSVLAQNDLSQKIERAFKHHDNNIKVSQLKSLDNTVFNQTNYKIKARYLRLLSRSLRDTSEFKQAHFTIDRAIKIVNNNQNKYEFGKLAHTKGVIYFKESNYPDAIKWLSQATAIYKEYGKFDDEVNATRRLAGTYRRIAQYHVALNLLTPLLSRKEQISDKAELGHLYGSIANIYVSLQLLPEALDLELKSLKTFNDAGFSEDKQAGSYYAIAELYRQLEDFNSAKIYFSKSLELDIKSGDRSYIGHSQVKMAQATLGLNQIDLSLDYATQALNTFSEINSERDQAWAKSNIALAHAKNKQFKLAEKYFEQSYQVISKREGDNSLLSSILYNLSEMKFNLQKYNEARKFGLESLNLLVKTPYLKYKVKTLEVLVKVETQNQNFEQASDYQNLLLNALKKLNTTVYNNRLSILQNSLDTVHKDLAIKELELDKSHKQTLLDQNKLRNQITILIYSIIVILLLGLILKLWNKRKIIKLEKRLLAESMERKKALFSDISHDLRTPLTVLKLQLESLEFDLVNDKDAEFRSMHEKINQLNQLVSDINELSRMDNDSINIIKEPFKCKFFISGFSNEFKSLASEFDYTEEIILDDNVMLLACRKKIQQVLANLASNSIKYTDVPGRIHFSCKQKHNKIVLSVSDASPGVPKKSQEKIFERLYTEEASRNRDLVGSGLGLAITKSIIEMHDGSIKAKESRLGGLKVIITLPLYKNETQTISNI